jgi:hypothetical protein
MALRSEVIKKDNSKLGRAVLNNRSGQIKSTDTTPPVTVSVVDVPKKKVSKKNK